MNIVERLRYLIVKCLRGILVPEEMIPEMENTNTMRLRTARTRVATAPRKQRRASKAELISIMERGGDGVDLGAMSHSERLKHLGI
jgi:hypothetical protein